MMEKVKNVPSLRFSEYTGEWSNSLLNELAVKITDGTHDTPKTVDRGVPYITAIHVKDGSIDFDGCYFVTEADHRIIYNRCNPQKDDLLIVNIGAGTATCSIVDVDYQFSMKNVALIKPDKAKVFPSFLAHYQRKRTHSMFVRLTSGGAQPFLSLRELGKLVVRYPSLPEQQKIALFLTAIDDKIQQLSKKKALLEQYKKGVMQQIFSQKLRFKDDQGNEFPDWEEKQLKDLAIIKYGKDQKQVIVEDGLYPILGTGGEIGRTNTFLYDKPSVLIGRKGTIDRPKYMSSPFWTVDTLFYTEALDGTMPKWLFYNFEMINWYLYNEASGVPSLSASTIYKVKFDVPCIEEQTKIANFLSAIDDKINGVTKQIEHTRQFKKGLLQQMFV